MPLIVFGKYEKWKVSAGLQIHPKKILKYTIKACKVREKDAQGTQIRRLSKASKVQRRIRHEGEYGTEAQEHVRCEGA